MAFAPLAAWSVVPTLAWKCLLSLPTWLQAAPCCFCAASGYRMFILCLLYHPERLEADRLLKILSVYTFHQAASHLFPECCILPGNQFGIGVQIPFFSSLSFSLILLKYNGQTVKYICLKCMILIFSALCIHSQSHHHNPDDKHIHHP